MTISHFHKAQQGGQSHLQPNHDLGAYRFATRRTRQDNPQHQELPAAQGSATSNQRPRGRLLIAVLIAIACGGGVLTVWESLIRYSAYGIVTGRIVQVASPSDGVLSTVHVQEGDCVTQDALLASVENLELQHKLSRVADELRVTQARLEAELSRVPWQARVDETELTRAVAQFHEVSAQLREESGQLNMLRDQLQRTQDLHQRGSATLADLVSQEIREQACEEKITAIEQALVVLKARAEQAAAATPPGDEQIQPLIAQADLLRNEMERLREQIAAGNLQAPCNGTVLRRLRPAGECVQSHDPILTVLQESTLEIEMYLPQRMSEQFRVGDVLELKIEPCEELIPFELVAIGLEHRKPPQQIAVFYRSEEQLLPVRLKPVSQATAARRIPVGAVAKLPWLHSRS